MGDTLTIRTVAEFAAAGELPEVVFWTGCAGSFDDRAKKITKAFARLLHKSGVSFAILGSEEGCTGDPAKRAGNEFLFQMQALQNIEVAFILTEVICIIGAVLISCVIYTCF